MANTQLPQHMSLAYKRYKRDTEDVATWLAEKAFKLGFVASASAPCPKQPKLRGRARKLARDAAKLSSSAAANGPKYTYTVKTTEFIQMATKIANAHPRIALSRSLQIVWQRAIQARRDFSDWFRLRSSIDPLADEKHAHFTAVLEKALELLQPCCELPDAPEPSRKVKEEMPKTPLEQMNNMFQHLEVENVSSDDEEPGTERNTAEKANKPAPARAYIEFKEEEAEAEFLFAIWSFLQDVTAVRVYVACTWQLYSTGAIELMQCASVTNFAVDLVRREEADFEASLQRPLKYPASEFPTGSLPFLIFKLHLDQANVGPLDFDPVLPSTVIICGCETCDMLLYVPWAMAKAYVNVLLECPPTLPTSNNDFAVDVPSFPSAKTHRAEFYHAKNPSQKATDELREILPTSCMLSLMFKNAFVEDEILHAARHLIENQSVPVWVSFAFQVQLDMQRLNDIKPIAAFEDLVASFADIKSRYKRHRAWIKSRGHAVWDLEGSVRGLVKEFGDWIVGSKVGRADPTEFNLRLAAGQDRESALRDTKRIPLVELFPLTCGTLKTELYLEWHVLGLKLVNFTSHVPMLCHLYNALRNLHPDAPIWPDLELVIRNQDPARVFIGGIPSTLEDSVKRFFLAMGMSSSMLARNSNNASFSKYNAQKHQFQNATIAGNLFARWLDRETRKVDEVAYQLQQVLSDPKYKNHLARRLFIPVQSRPDELKMTLLNTEMVRVLISFSEGFAAEMPAFMFDYFAMECSCYDFYLRLKDSYRPRLGNHDTLGSEEEEKINSPVSMTIAILTLARNAEAITHNMRSRRAESKAKGPAVAKLMKSHMMEYSDEKANDFVESMINLARKEGAAELIQMYVDISEHALARNTFQPMLATLQDFLKATKSDSEIRKLKTKVGKSDYGIHLFSRGSLQALYGSQPPEVWADLLVSEDKIDAALKCNAANPALVVLTILYLRQKKVMCGKGEDSHSARLLKEINPAELAENTKFQSQNAKKL
ncbi:hypothetical protein RBB50_007620 [Rhinocladiella similis]